ncbi:MAG: hypothetical protein GDA36_09100 [Rhodobacteraceae bacterium]|nr:hypothetical protein [Paracoccaceae bacterium]
MPNAAEGGWGAENRVKQGVWAGCFARVGLGWQIGLATLICPIPAKLGRESGGKADIRLGYRVLNRLRKPGWGRVSGPINPRNFRAGIRDKIRVAKGPGNRD